MAEDYRSKSVERRLDVRKAGLRFGLGRVRRSAWGEACAERWATGRSPRVDSRHAAARIAIDGRRSAALVGSGRPARFSEVERMRFRLEESSRNPRLSADSGSVQRRGRDLNPRSALRRITVFEPPPLQPNDAR